MQIAVRLAKAGYYGGSVQGVLEANVYHVMTAIEYEAYESEYENSVYELNKES